MLFIAEMILNYCYISGFVISDIRDTVNYKEVMKQYPFGFFLLLLILLKIETIRYYKPLFRLFQYELQINESVIMVTFSFVPV